MVPLLLFSEDVPMELTTGVKTISVETGVSIEEKGYVVANFSMKEFLAENDVTADTRISSIDVPVEDITIEINTLIGQAILAKEKASIENEVLLSPLPLERRVLLLLVVNQSRLLSPLPFLSYLRIIPSLLFSRPLVVGLL